MFFFQQLDKAGLYTRTKTAPTKEKEANKDSNDERADKEDTTDETVDNTPEAPSEVSLAPVTIIIILHYPSNVTLSLMYIILFYRWNKQVDCP